MSNEPNSRAAPEKEEKDKGMGSGQADVTKTEKPGAEQGVGEISTSSTSPDPQPVDSFPRETRAQAERRWRREGISYIVADFRDRVRVEYKADHPGCKGRDAHEYAWERAIAEYPPPGVSAATPAPQSGDSEEGLSAGAASTSDNAKSAGSALLEEGLRGLADIPADWPPLPDNASLPAEVAWVQAQRLRVVVGSGDQATVHLERAGTPAPSWAALGWLETSIRAYSKWCDICARATAGQDDEQADTRKERLAIGEIHGLLSEMEADVCPHCGKLFGDPPSSTA